MSLLEFKAVSAGEGQRARLHRLDLSIEAGECLVAFGRSGSGKRVLMKLAAGVAQPEAGTVVLSDPRREPGLPVGFVPGEGGLLSNMTLLQNTILPVVYHHLLPRDKAEIRGRELLDRLGVSASADRRPAQAGAGARRLTQLARAFLADPALFVMDDPLEELDAAAVKTVRKLLDELKKARKAAVLVSTGHLSDYLAWGDRFLFCREGGVTVYKGRQELEAADDPELQLFLQ